MGSWRASGGERPSFKAKAVFEAILAAILTLRPPPLGPPKSAKRALKWDPKSKPFLRRVLKAVGLDFGSLLGLILEPRARHAIFYENGTALQREHDF